MAKHCKAFTYGPKIPAVRAGTCRQTIRPRGIVEKGDSILFHGWEGRPYRSPWSWRLRVTVSEVHRVSMCEDGIWFGERLLPWEKCHFIAQLDGFMDGFQMRDYFQVHNNLNGGVEMDIIRWFRPEGE